jgi:flavin-dependent dehydrogenase
MKSLSVNNPVNSIRIIAPDSRSIDLQFKESGSVIKRRHFDAFLFDLVKELPNIHVFKDTQINKVEVRQRSVKVQADDGRELQSQIVVGCDGSQSRVRRLLHGSGIDREFHAGGVRAYFKQVKDVEQNRIEFIFIKDLLPFYLWIFPLHDRLVNVGLGMLSEQLSEKRISLRNALPDLIEREPHLKERFSNAVRLSEIEGCGLPLAGREKPISGHRLMLCGDAASLIDPLSGEGIGQAMISGRYAAWHAIKCFEKRDFSAQMMRGYDRMVYEKLKREQKKHLLIRKLIGKRLWLINAAVRSGLSSQTLLGILRKTVW